MLVIDSDTGFLEELEASGSSSVRTASNGKAAHRILSDPDQPLSAIFINPRTVNPSGLVVIRLAHQYRPSIPIFLVHEGQVSPFSESELSQLGIQRAIPKPATLERLQACVAFEAAAQEAIVSASLAEEGVEVIDGGPQDDSSYFSVRASNFLSGGKTCFDLHLRLGSGRYIKVLRAGDLFASDRLRNYLRKGVTVFHVRKEDHETYLGHCDQLISRLLTNPDAPIDIKVTQTIQYGHETIRFLGSHGLQPAQIQHAVNFVGQISQMVNQMNLRNKAFFNAFLSNLVACDHGAGVAIVASLAAPSLRLGCEHSPSVIGLAAFFHDIGLQQMPIEVQDEDESRMSEEHRTIYRTHPAVGASLLRTVPDLPPAAVEIVAQHHDRLEKGFTTALLNRSQAAELIGISDEFVKLIQKAKSNPRLRPLEEMERSVFGEFSRPVVDAFRNFFFLTLL